MTIQTGRRAGLFLFALLLLLGALGACAPARTQSSQTTNPSGDIPVVAAENFYGDLLQHVGGAHVAVTSIIANPATDPHEYEPNYQDSVAVSDAQIVVMNGAGYDTWMQKLLDASPNSERIVLSADKIVPHQLPDNPHFWYDPQNMQALAQQIRDALKKIDSAHAADYDKNAGAATQSLNQIEQKIASIKAKYAGTPVGLTEDIYLYQAQALGLNVLTPLAFEKAIAEGNDPPADSVASANTQLSQHQIKVLIYNEQTVTPITTNLENAARKQHIPLVAVSETMPQGKSYQQWMLDQLDSLEQALQQA